MIPLKKTEEIKLMKKAGRIVGEVLRTLSEYVKEDVPTLFFDELAERITSRMGGVPAFKGYKGYPANVCVSINDEIVHGIPAKNKILKSGDIVSFDFGVIYRGYYADGAITVPVGEIEENARNLLEVTRGALNKALKYLRDGFFLGDVCWSIQNYVEKHGFSVIRDFVGHGIGKSLHEEPQIPNYGKRGTPPELKSGMTLALEPMVSEGSWEVEITDDGWTAKTKDGSLAAHFEHTLLVTSNEPEILTMVD